MRQASVLLDRDFAIGDTDPRLFGAFVEHLGRCVYGGIYEPGHPTADEQGFRARRARPRHGARADDHALSRRQLRLRLQLGGRRRPGRGAPDDGSTSPGSRPSRTPSAPTSSSTGAAPRSVEPMLAVNLGTRGGDAARNLVEYCNHPGGTHYVGPAAQPRLRGAARRSSSGASATRWTAPGRWSTRPRPSTAASPRRRRR